MATLVFVEVLGRNERVLSRQAIDTLPCNIGRAYDNHVILDDPFVRPHHARIERSADGVLSWTVLDDATTLPIDPRQGMACTLGRTKLRLRTPAFEVEAVHVDPMLSTRIGRIAHSGLGRALALLAGFSSILANAHFTEYTPDFSEHVNAVVGLVLMLVAWAALWTLIGRIRSSRNTLSMHLAAAAAALAPLALGQSMIAAVYSMHPTPVIPAIVSPLWFAAVLSGLVTVHGLLIGVPSVRSAAMRVGLTFGASVLVIVLVTQVADSAKFSSELEIETMLVPLPQALLVTDAPDQFVQRAADLRLTLENDLASP